MLGEPHPRSAHRANPEGGLALLTRQALAGPALARQALARQGLTRQAPPQHRQTHAARPPRQRHAPSRRRPVCEPQQAMQTLMSGLGALIIVAIVALSAFFVIADKLRAPGRESAAPPVVSPAAISSRDLDREPLTQREVFPAPKIRLVAGAAPYRVTMTHIDTDCGVATTGELGALLDAYGCDQVVRAGLSAPFGGYQVTAGIFNLADADGAALVAERAAKLVESGRGSFAAMGGLGSDPLVAPPAQVGWHHRGHYVLYCVIARPDGRLVADDDPYAERITAELVEQYLGETVVGRRALEP